MGVEVVTVLSQIVRRVQEKYSEAIAVQETRASALAPSAAPSHNRCATSSLTSSVELVLSRVVAAVAIRFTPLKTVSQRVVHGIVEGMNYASHNSFAPFFLCGNASSVVSLSMTPKPGALKIVSETQQQQHEHQARLRCDIQRVARDVLESVVRHAAVRASEMHAAMVDALEQRAEQPKAAENAEMKPEIISTEAPSATVIIEAEPVADCSDEPYKQPPSGLVSLLETLRLDFKIEIALAMTMKIESYYLGVDKSTFYPKQRFAAPVQVDAGKFCDQIGGGGGSAMPKRIAGGGGSAAIQKQTKPDVHEEMQEPYGVHLPTQLQLKVMRSIIGDQPTLRFGGATDVAKVEFATHQEIHQALDKSVVDVDFVSIAGNGRRLLSDPRIRQILNGGTCRMFSKTARNICRRQCEASHSRLACSIIGC